MIEFDNTKYYCEKCGKELTTDEITSVCEERATEYSVDFRCIACAYISRFKISNEEHILDMVPLRLFSSIHYLRIQECAGCEERMYDFERDGIEPCDCMGEYYRTGSCKRKRKPKNLKRDL